ncbi:5'-AMP-activated protein kinase subunit beta-2 [Homalodisca vitripennis]|nr:5'-AMP-activated protein kinase subunit beta-2 [Homalodisca vitripennis]
MQLYSIAIGVEWKIAFEAYVWCRPHYTKKAFVYKGLLNNDSVNITENEIGAPRKRAATLSEGSKIPTGIDDSVLPTVFKWEGGGRNVMISGTFSDWKALPMVKSHGDFVTIIDLPEGEHQYKFCVDGDWRYDPGVRTTDNGMGSKNNLVTVKRSDFEVFQALAMDSESASERQHREYSQEIPANRPWEKPSGPPILPPHLLQVILNKDTPLSAKSL